MMLSISGVMLILGYLTYKNTLTALGVWNSSSPLQIFLKVDASENEKTKLLADLKAEPEVAEVILTDRKQAAESFKNSIQSSVQSFLSDDELIDLLPESIEVNLRAELSIDQRQVIYGNLAEKFISAVGVDEVVDNSTWLKKFDRIDRFVRAAGLSVFIVVLCLLSYMMSLLLKVYIDESRADIEVYTLLGATRWSIYRIFLSDLLQILLGGSVLTLALSLILFKLLRNYLIQAGLSMNIVENLQFLNFKEAAVFFLLLFVCILSQSFYTIRSSLHSLNKLSYE
jgi:cell division transport system permease protein